MVDLGHPLQPDLERIAGLKPDLIIGASYLRPVARQHLAHRADVADQPYRLEGAPRLIGRITGKSAEQMSSSRPMRRERLRSGRACRTCDCRSSASPRPAFQGLDGPPPMGPMRCCARPVSTHGLRSHHRRHHREAARLGGTRPRSTARRPALCGRSSAMIPGEGRCARCGDGRRILLADVGLPVGAGRAHRVEGEGLGWGSPKSPPPTRTSTTSSATCCERRECGREQAGRPPRDARGRDQGDGALHSSPRS